MSTKSIKVSKGTAVEVKTDMDELIETRDAAHEAYKAADKAVKDHAAFLTKEAKKSK